MTDDQRDTWCIAYQHTALSVWRAESGIWDGRNTYDRDEAHRLATAYANRLTGLNVPA